MKRTRVTAMLLTLALVMGIASAALADYDAYKMYVSANTKKVKLYEDMSKYSDVLVKVPVGKKVTVYDIMPGAKWASVSYNGYYGYMPFKYLEYNKPKPKPTKKPVPKPTAKPTAKPNPTAKPVRYEDMKKVDYYVRVTLSSPTARMNMRWEPDTTADVIGVYADGTILWAMQEGDKWIQVMDEENNRVGYMSRKYLVKTDPETEVDGEYDSELVVNPINNVDTLEALKAAVPNVYLPDAPEGSTDVRYDWITGNPVIAQITFTVNGVEHCLRAAYCENEEQVIDIDGLHTPTHEAVSESDIHVALDDENGAAVAHFFSAENQTQYSLAGSGANDGADALALAKAIFPTK